MIRVLFIAVALTLFGSSLFCVADPAKKEKPADHEKLAKEHVEAFMKEIKAQRYDDAAKRVTIPFRATDGLMIKGEEVFQNQMKSLPQNMEVVIKDVVDVSKMNEYLKKQERKEYSEKTIDSLKELVDKSTAKIVFAEIKINDVELAKDILMPFFIVKFSEKDVKIIGIGGGPLAK
jgi:hypothetical protein